MVRMMAVRVTSLVVLCASVVTIGCGGIDGAQPASVDIAPHQTFVGEVNGDQIQASVDVDCPGPSRLGQTGHPASGQTVGVSTPAPPIAGTGTTGSRGRSITVRFITASSAVAIPAVTFSHYGTEPLPTSGMLPCSGSGTVVFSPLPTSRAGRVATVSVTYVSTCTNPCPVDKRR